jgi:cellobiose phosphorylase
METLLGVRLTGGTLRVEPCVWSSGAEFAVTYRHRSETSRFQMANQTDTIRSFGMALLDVQPVPGGDVPTSDEQP